MPRDGVWPRSRRSSVFQTPVDGIPCCKHRDRRSVIDRAPNRFGSMFGCELWREVDLLGRVCGGMVCVVRSLSGSPHRMERTVPEVRQGTNWTAERFRNENPRKNSVKKAISSNKAR